jgi:hypothetical protein
MTKIKNKYDFFRLETFCNENNINLLNDYKNIKITRDTMIEAICLTPNCNGIINKSFRRILDNGGCYCLKCVQLNSYLKIKNTSLKKYGVEHYFMSKDIIEKRKQTCLNKYGVEYTLQCKDVIEKRKKTCLDKYGFENPNQSKEVIDKRKKTTLEKYGVEHCLQLKEVIDKRKKTTLEKYGVEHALQNSDIADKAFNTSYSLKVYTLPSGKQIKYQGYEHFALNELIYSIDENDIITGCKNVPRIIYKDENGKNHYHFVDIFIKSQNKCIEVKSTWTFKKKKDNVLLKQTAAKELGYEYEIWVYDSKGVKIDCLK